MGVYMYNIYIYIYIYIYIFVYIDMYACMTTHIHTISHTACSTMPQGTSKASQIPRLARKVLPRPRQSLQLPREDSARARPFPRRNLPSPSLGMRMRVRDSGPQQGARCPRSNQNHSAECISCCEYAFGASDSEQQPQKQAVHHMSQGALISSQALHTSCYDMLGLLQQISMAK